MEGRATAAELVVVYGGEVVVNQTESVDQFDCCCGREAGLTGCADGGACVPRKYGAEALTAAEEGVSDCVIEAGGQGTGCERLREVLLDGGQWREDMRGRVHLGKWGG
jgi:hypothetical protein